jgi:hypothetical protein
MSKSLIPRRPGNPDQVLSGQVVEAQRPGINAVVRIQGAAFASSVAMHHACMLSRTADAAFKTSPMGEDSYRSILMAFSTVAVTEIQALSLDQREWS